MKLEIDSVTLAFNGRRILSDVYMSFEKGKITGILGRNGSGKSCLLKILFGTLDSEYSHVSIDGKAVTELYRYPDKARYLPQFTILPKKMRLRDAMSIYSVNENDFTGDIPEISNWLDCKNDSLSYGQRRLFEIVLFLKSNSDFLIFDEPFSYLMPLHSEKIMAMMTEKKKTSAIIITDHLYRDLLSISDDIYLITDGISRKISNPEQLKTFGYLK